MIYTRVLIWIMGDASLRVVGVKAGTFHPEGCFTDANDAFQKALSLRVRDPLNPINVIRKTEGEA